MTKRTKENQCPTSTTSVAIGHKANTLSKTRPCVVTLCVRLVSCHFTTTSFTRTCAVLMLTISALWFCEVKGSGNATSE